jgi:hypothetical protein
MENKLMTLSEYMADKNPQRHHAPHVKLERDEVRIYPLSGEYKAVEVLAYPEYSYRLKGSSDILWVINPTDGKIRGNSCFRLNFDHTQTN